MDNHPTRPAPLGAFGLPFGFLLLPPGADTEPAREALLAGRLPETWPDALAGHKAALDGDFDTARKEFADEDPVSRFNRFVIDPEEVDADALRAAGDPYRILVDLVLFATGRSDEAPDPSGHDGELAALLLAARAIADGEPDADLLRQAVEAAAPVSPALAGVLHGALAQALKAAGDPGAAIATLTAGTGLLKDTDLDVARAEQHLELAATFHEMAASGDRPDLVGQAVSHYHNVLQTLGAEGESQNPELFAAAHAGLGTAYLTMPMNEASDQLRLGVAVGSLRSALSVYTRETHPGQWSSAQLNLANALVYAPSTHRQENLSEAVELYEAVLQTRDRNSDPVGYARALANQANTLAHLGERLVARAKLGEARALFEEAEDWDAVNQVRELLDELGRVNADA